MADRKSKPPKDTEISDVITVIRGRFDVHVLGVTPIIFNRPSEKTQHQLLMPSGRKSAVQKATSLKHIPIEEYQASPYRDPDPNGPTLLQIQAAAFKKAMLTAALDLPTTKKAQIGRLVQVLGEYVGIYGTPQLHMTIVRSADMARTPDVRTRAIVREWAAKFSVQFVQPLIRANAVANLLAAAGITAGVGDGRVEKGALDFGQFKLVDEDDPKYLDVIAQGGREVQETAMVAPTCYDEKTAELLAWFDTELQRRQLRGIA